MGVVVNDAMGASTKTVLVLVLEQAPEKEVVVSVIVCVPGVEKLTDGVVAPEDVGDADASNTQLEIPAVDVFVIVFAILAQRVSGSVKSDTGVPIEMVCTVVFPLQLLASVAVRLTE